MNLKSRKKFFQGFVLAFIFSIVLNATAVFAGEYVVQKGDYLVKIATNHNTTWRELQELNNLPNPNLIFPGQVLKVPNTDDEAVTETAEIEITEVEATEEKETVATEEKEEVIKTITILGTSDLHGNAYSYSYEDQKETTNNGVARIASYLKEVRGENPNAILLDVGDTIQGTILTDDLYNKRNAVRGGADFEHVMMTALNELKYDAMTLGNHEFNFGLGVIEKIAKEANFPIVVGNVTYKSDGSNFLEPYTIIEREGYKIGVLGLVTPMVPRWDGEKVDALDFHHIGESAAKYAKELKEEKGVDFVVALVHAGWIPEYDEENLSDGAIAVQEYTDLVDAMFIGHAHILFEKNDGVNSIVVGAPRNSGRDVVRIDLGIDESGKIVNKNVKLIDMADYAPDEEFRKIVEEPHQATLNFINGGGGSDDGEEGSSGIFGIATADFQPTNEIKDIPEGKLRDTAVMTLINDVQLHYSGADVSAAALFKDTSDIKAGEIKYSNIFDIYKFDNQLYVVEVTGKELKAYMEWSAECYNQWKEGDISISFNPEKPGYLYDMFAGVDYKIDLSQEAGNRIKDVMFKGEPLRDDQILKLAVNNYRYSSGLKAYDLVEGKKTWESSGSIRDYLVEYISEKGEVSPYVNNNWEIVGVDLESPYREQVIEMVNNGEIEVPYAESLNVNKLLESGIIK